MARAACRAVERSESDATVATQGYRIRVEDFVDTLVTEATIHYLDLIVELDAAAPPAHNLACTRERVERLLGSETPRRWTDAYAVLALTGRSELGTDDVAELGEARLRVPVIR